MATIHIKNLKLRTFIGFQEWEKDKLQDIIINISFAYEADKASKSDDVHDAVDYKLITKKIIHMVENSKFNLLEKLANSILNIVLEPNAVKSAQVEIDKPHALRFADSVSITVQKSK